MRSMGLCCGCAFVESRLSTAGAAAGLFLSAGAASELAEWWRGRPRCRMERAGGDEGDEEGGEWAWPLDIGDGWGDREERRRAGQRENMK